MHKRLSCLYLSVMIRLLELAVLHSALGWGRLTCPTHPADQTSGRQAMHRARESPPRSGTCYCAAARALLQAALCAAQCARWHRGEQYCAMWHLLHRWTGSSCSEGPSKLSHLRCQAQTQSEQLSCSVTHRVISCSKALCDCGPHSGHHADQSTSTSDHCAWPQTYGQPASAIGLPLR